jgi:hypothetical protein
MPLHCIPAPGIYTTHNQYVNYLILEAMRSSNFVYSLLAGCALASTIPRDQVDALSAFEDLARQALENENATLASDTSDTLKKRSGKARGCKKPIARRPWLVLLWRIRLCG